MKENTEFHLSVVFLDSNRPTEQLKMMERNSIWGHQVQFLHGSVLVSTSPYSMNRIFCHSFSHRRHLFIVGRKNFDACGMFSKVSFRF